MTKIPCDVMKEGKEKEGRKRTSKFMVSVFDFIFGGEYLYECRYVTLTDLIKIIINKINLSDFNHHYQFLEAQLLSN